LKRNDLPTARRSMRFDICKTIGQMQVSVTQIILAA
jgi:hypothetical protein